MKHLQRTLALVLALLLALGTMSALAASGTVKVNKKNFPDAVFRKYVLEKIDTDGNKKLDAKEIAKVKKINISDNTALKSLQGIEYFTNLTQLTSYWTSLTTLDVSKNTKLRRLELSDEYQLTSLKLGNLKKLSYLDTLFSESLKSIDIGGCPKLVSVLSKPVYMSDVVAWNWGDSTNALRVSSTTRLLNGKKVLRKYAKPKSIEFSQKTLTLKVGKNYKLGTLLKLNPVTSVYPVTYSTKSTSILEVSEDGEINALKKGTATVTARINSKIKATIKVKVK